MARLSRGSDDHIKWRSFSSSVGDLKKVTRVDSSFANSLEQKKVFRDLPEISRGGGGLGILNLGSEMR